MVGAPGGIEMRRGFTLVEVVVALPLLGIGVLGAAAVLLLSLRLLREAEAHAEAVALAATVLDSLARVADPDPGERLGPRHEARWSVRGEVASREIELEVGYHDGSGRRVVRFAVPHPPLPPVPGSAP